MKDDALLGALCDIVMEVKAAQAVAPQLVDMFEERDVELFFVLPRIVMLLFAVDPECRRAEMVRNLLPHRFQPSTSSSGAPVVARQSVELEAFSRKATEALAQLGAPNGYRSSVCLRVRSGLPIWALCVRMRAQRLRLIGRHTSWMPMEQRAE